MRSTLFTLILGLFALIVVSVAALRLTDEELARMLGAPGASIGDTLYAFPPEEVVGISLSSNGVDALCRRTPAGWQMVAPWEDRMDPRAAQTLFNFVLQTRVEGVIPRNQVQSLNLDFEDGRISVRMANAENDPLAKFRIGHRTAWVATDPDSQATCPTLFLEPRDKSRKDYLYACTDPYDIHALLGDGFAKLRDHRPFFFHPRAVEAIRLRNRRGELKISRSATDAPFQIIKPLDLRVDRDAVIRLLQGLYNLEASEVISRSTITLPDPGSEHVEIVALSFFGRDSPTVLEIHRPEAAEGKSLLATVSDRPSAVFRLPTQPLTPAADTPSRTTLDELPLTVNALRDPTLAQLAPSAVAEILVSPALGDDIVARRPQPQRDFEVTLQGRRYRASETALLALFQAINEGKVAAFVSDSAVDLETYGLDSPFLMLRFGGFDGEQLRIDFGSPPGSPKVYAIRRGTTTVVEIKPEVLELIPDQTWDWRPPLIWRLSSVDVRSIVRQSATEGEIILDILNPVTEAWRARLDGRDVTDRLEKARAEILLRRLLDLEARNWLSPRHPRVQALLADPDLTFTLFVSRYDSRGEKVGVDRRELRLVSHRQDAVRLCYGQVVGDPNPFLLSPETVDLLAVDLLLEE